MFLRQWMVFEKQMFEQSHIPCQIRLSRGSITSLSNLRSNETWQGTNWSAVPERITSLSNLRSNETLEIAYDPWSATVSLAYQTYVVMKPD